MRDDLNGKRNDLAEVLPHPHEDVSQELGALLDGRLGAKQGLDIWCARRHGREEQALLAAEALVEDPLRDPRLARDRASRCRTPLFAKDLPGYSEQLLI